MIPKAHWSYPENVEAIALPVPEFLADKQTDIHTYCLVYLE